MNIPVVQGTIARRMLVNFRADPGVVQALLPAPFRPKTHAGFAIVGVCLIRLEKIRPKGWPALLGMSSENAAHRFAVEWDGPSGVTEGVFIPRRDTGSALNYLAGGRIFPGEHHWANFKVSSKNEVIRFAMRSRDGKVCIRLKGQPADFLPGSSCFASVREASAFFEGGCTGFSVRHNSSELDGLVLATRSWKVDALLVTGLEASYFDDISRFPSGSIEFDHALLMQNIEHEWCPAPSLPPAPVAGRIPLATTTCAD